MAQRSPLRRLLRWTGIGIALLVVLAVAVAAYTVATFDPNSLKPQLVAEVRALTGRTLALNGPIRLRLSLHPSVEARDVILANPPDFSRSGFSRPEMVRLGALELGLGLGALLHGQIVIDRLTLARPDILLERTRAGAVNWTFVPQAGVPQAGAPQAGMAATPSATHRGASGGHKFSLFVRTVRVTDATLGYRDDATGKVTLLHVSALTFAEPTPAAPLTLNARGALNGTPVALRIATGTLTALLAGNAVPLHARLGAAGADLTVDGTVAKPLLGAGIALGVRATVPSLRALGALAGANLPKLALGLTGKLALPGRLAQGGRIEGLALRLPGGTIAGNLVLRLGKVAAVSGNLGATSFDADTLLAGLRGPPVPVKAGGAAAPGPATAPARYVIPTAPLPLGGLRVADADLHLSVGALTVGGEVWHALALHLVLNGGRLGIAPFTATPPAGRLDGAFTLDAASARPPVSLRLHAPGLALAALLKLAGQSGLASGAVALDLDLHGAGASPHAIAASLTGTAIATMQGGSIDNRVVNKLFGPMLAKANLAGLLAHGGQSQIRCFAARMDAANGAGRLAPFLFASTVNTIDGGGTLNLGAETLDLTFRPQARVGGRGIAVPVHVGGTFAAPVYGISQGAVAQAGIGAVLSLLAGKKLTVPTGLQARRPSCAAALAEAHGAAPPPVPAAAPAPARGAKNPTSPGALLRQLFH